ncbi:MAG: SPOR domain-containing protein, partial [Aestuariivirgaceae bacterium]
YAAAPATNQYAATPATNQYAAAPVATNNGNFFVQVAAFSDQNNAHRTQARLSTIGPVVITPVSASIGTIYRVQMGPLPDEFVAQSVLNQVVDAGHHDARLLRIAQN